MFFNTLFSGTLLGFPVLVTLGLYIGLNWNHINDTIIKGEIPAGWTPNIGGGSSPSAPSGKLRIEQYCQKAYGIDLFPGRYTLNPNTWGDDENTGALCLNVTVDPKVTKDQKYAPTFNVTWGFPQRQGQPVHAYPNAKLTSGLPVTVNTINNLFLDVSWTYASGNSAATVGATSVPDLTAATLNANVAVDMFLSDSKDQSADASKATHEVMVWFARYGDATFPLGYPTDGTPVTTQTIGDTTFKLYVGVNGQKQNVFTWVAPDNTFTFKGDLMPLLTASAAQATGPKLDGYLGYYAFGTEAFYSSKNVTFGVQTLDMDVTTS